MTACDRMFVLYGEVSACTKVPVDATFQAQLVARAKEWITAPPEMRTAIEAACTDSVKELETQLATCQRLPPLEPEGA